jgi:hypothetical protein
MSDGVRFAVRAGDRSGGRLEASENLVGFDVSASLEHQSGSLEITNIARQSAGDTKGETEGDMDVRPRRKVLPSKSHPRLGKIL